MDSKEKAYWVSGITAGLTTMFAVAFTMLGYIIPVAAACVGAGAIWTLHGVTCHIERRRTD